MSTASKDHEVHGSRSFYHSLICLCQFPCKNVTGDLLFDQFWEVVYRLERCGFKVVQSLDNKTYNTSLKVLGVTSDGASTNRQLKKIHDMSGNLICVSSGKIHTPLTGEIIFSDSLTI